MKKDVSKYIGSIVYEVFINKIEDLLSKFEDSERNDLMYDLLKVVDKHSEKIMTEEEIEERDLKPLQIEVSLVIITKEGFNLMLTSGVIFKKFTNYSELKNWSREKAIRYRIEDPDHVIPLLRFSTEDLSDIRKHMGE